MSEIVTLHIGQAGCQIGAKFWRLMLNEENLDQDGKEFYETDVYHECMFDERSDGSWAPRTIIVDTDPAVINEIISQNKFFDELYIQSGKGDSNSVFSRGSMGQNTLLEATSDAFRKQVESCHNLHCLMHTHSISGGTGSGMSFQLMDRLIDTGLLKAHCQVHDHVLVPEPQIGPVLSDYNAVLYLSKTKFDDLIFFYENDVMYNVLHGVFNRTLKTVPHTFGHLNYMISRCLADVTSYHRFEKPHGMDLPSLATNLVPYPEMKYCAMSIGPLVNNKTRMKCSTYTITCDVFLRQNELCSIDWSQKYISNAMVYRGKGFDSFGVNVAWNEWKSYSEEPKYVGYIPTGGGLKISHCEKMAYVRSESILQENDQSVLKISNHIGMITHLETANEKYNKIFNRRYFTFWYTLEGMEEGQFLDASESVERIVEKYKEIAAKDNEKEEESGEDEEDEN